MGKKEIPLCGGRVNRLWFLNILRVLFRVPRVGGKKMDGKQGVLQ